MLFLFCLLNYLTANLALCRIAITLNRMDNSLWRWRHLTTVWALDIRFLIFYRHFLWTAKSKLFIFLNVKDHLNLFAQFQRFRVRLSTIDPTAQTTCSKASCNTNSPTFLLSSWNFKVNTVKSLCYLLILLKTWAVWGLSPNPTPIALILSAS